MLQRWITVLNGNPEGEAIIHWRAGEPPFRWTYGELFRSAEALSLALSDAGIKKGEVCALIFRHHPDFYPLYIAVVLLGAIPAVLAYPNSRLHPEKFKQGIRGMAQNSGLDWILTERELEPAFKDLIHTPGSTIKGIHFPLEKKVERGGKISGSYSARPTDPFLLQHSSGTTGLQKPVLLSHGAVGRHLDHYAAAIQLTKSDKVVSWLPLYHDMGLIAAFHLPLAFGIPTIQINPFEWVQAPVLLLEALSKEKATLAWMPNFAFSVMSERVHDEEMEGLSLKSLRMLINCSEPILEESRKKFVEKFSRYGLKKEAVSSCYAMAEATFAVTQTQPGAVPASILKEGKNRVSSGKLIPGCEIRVISEDKKILPEGGIGEILIRSDSLFDGYRNYPEKTAEVLKDGWYHSGDLGFVQNGETYIIGRKKDLIISGGQNFYPEDIEQAAADVPGVIPGRIMAVGVDDPELGTEQVCVIAETELKNEDELEDLRRRIREAVSRADVTVGKVYLVAPRWLIKSSAGKPSRKENKERMLKNDLG